MSEHDGHVTADEYAELLRAHTRAIWALRLDLPEDERPDYPPEERQAMGRKASAILAHARRAETAA